VSNLVAQVEALVTADRRRRAGGLAAHHRTDPDDRDEPSPAADPGPLADLGAAVEDFDRAWSRLRREIRRAVEGRQGR
jgi:hypothetical protein